MFWDTGLCKNADFELTMYTPYKMVSYEVWRVRPRSVGCGSASQPHQAHALNLDA